MLIEYSIPDIIDDTSTERCFHIGKFEKLRDSFVQHPHRHDFYSIVWFTCGLGVNIIDFKEYEITSNRLFIIRPKQVHDWNFSDKCKGYVLVFDKYFIDNIPFKLINVSFLDLLPQHSSIFKLLFDTLLNEFDKKDKLSEKIMISGINFLLFQLVRLATELQEKEKIESSTSFILQFFDLIGDNISENKPINWYANKLQISIEKLNQICKTHYGQSPKTIILDKKITEAKRLLYFTKLSIKEISFRLGFEDSSYFSRVFKQKTCLSPSEFKAKVPE